MTGPQQADPRLYARQGVTPTQSFVLDRGACPESLTAGYAGLQTVLSGQTGYGSAWKLGGTTATTRAVFGVDCPYFGVLHDSEVLVTPKVGPHLPLIELKAEAEMCLRLGPAVDMLAQTGWKALDDIAPSALFDAWCWGLEFPSSPIDNLVDCGAAALVADRCAAGALVLGPLQHSTGHWPNDTLVIRQDGEDMATGNLGSLLDAPEVSLHMFLQEAVHHRFHPRSGQWVASGGLTPCVPLREGAQVQLIAGHSVVLVMVLQRTPK